MEDKLTIRDITLRGGVLIIGSLLWDTNKIREHWRNTYLETLTKASDFPAPIRYGRISKERNCTFSMVFSHECIVNGNLGNAKLIEFNNNPVNLESLWLQTSALISAETNKENPGFETFNWRWGALGLSINPASVLNSEKQPFIELLKLQWKVKYGVRLPLIPNDFKVGNEDSIFTEDGILKIDWPKDKYQDIDFFIATATKPERGDGQQLTSYPDAKNIADRIRVNEYDSYFNGNIASGIKTFQDSDIQKAL